MKFNLNVYFLVLLTSASFISGCIAPNMAVNSKATMHSQNGHGLLIYYGNTSEIQTWISPTIPGSYIPTSPKLFLNRANEQQLPDSVTVAYQYAELSDCYKFKSIVGLENDEEFRLQGRVDNRYGQGYTRKGPLYIKKDSCKTWKPIGKKITSTINLIPYQTSKEMKRHGKKKGGGYSYANVVFEFYDDEVIKVRMRNGTTNPWK